ncbi:relaxase/mobilization nuclease domain-containing protein [Salmonella enterica subsp. enterica]|nr:relaxase/mobilization nuclease domain-containing protein [Salmonella enterica subsp. enterica]
MTYTAKKAALIGGSEAKFTSTSLDDYTALALKKFDQVNKKHIKKNGRNQEQIAIHEMISFDASDSVTPEQAAEIALSIWREVIDLDNRKYRFAVHTDTDETHVHLVWNKRDNSGKIYYQKDDYRIFEQALYEAEKKHGLKIVENRKFLKPDIPTDPKSSNEFRHEKRGFKSEKSKFKDDVKALTENALTAAEFLECLDASGYTLLINGALSYSLEKDGQIFKASDVGASYKHLKARLGDDPDFAATLARLGVKNAPVRDFGSISGFQFETDEQRDKRNKKQTLYTRFETTDDQTFRFKNSNRPAFTYSSGEARFNTNSPLAIKAGIQKLIEDTGTKSIKISGSEAFRRNAWLEFHKMKLDQKGFELSGYVPTEQDKKTLEAIIKKQDEMFKKEKPKDEIKKKSIYDDLDDTAKDLEDNKKKAEIADRANKEETRKRRRYAPNN